MEKFLSAAIGSSSLEYARPEDQSDKGFLGVSPETWVRVLIITGLFAAVFWPNLRRLWLKTNPFTGEANWSHAVVVPIIGLYYLFVHREDLLRAGPRQFVWGPLLRRSRAIAAVAMLVTGAGLFAVSRSHSSIIFSMLTAIGVATLAMAVLVLLLDWSLAWTLFGLGVFVYGIYPGQNDYLKDLGMVITLFGIVLMLNGPEVMKIAWFPIAFLVCAIPWPGLVYSWVAEPLQTMAATVAVHVLNLTGVDSVVSGTKIVINNFNGRPPRVLNVAEACAGMRSLMTFIAVGGAIAFLSPRPLWQKLIVVVSAVPIAIFCNVMRISGQGLLDHYVSPQWSESFAHQFVGMMMLLPAFFLILGVGYLLDKLFIEEADEDDAGPQLATGAAMPAARSAVAPQSAPPTVDAKPSPAARAPMAAPVSVPKPAVAAAVSAPAKVSAIPAPPRAVANSPEGRVPPRPVTAVNPRAVPPAYGLPPRTGFVPPARPPLQPNTRPNPAANAAQQRPPAEPLKPVARPPAGSPGVPRVPPPQPNAAKPADPQSARDPK